MDRLFRIDFYPQDWVIDTSRLSLEQRGLYIQIISLIYSNRGPIENDPSWIAGASGCSSRKAKLIIDELAKMGFIKFSGSKITQKRCENELEIKREHLENCSNGGRKSAENRTKPNENKNIGSSDASESLSAPYPTPNPSPSNIIKMVIAEEEGRTATANTDFFEWNREELNELPPDVGKIVLGQRWALPNDWGKMAEKSGLHRDDIILQSEYFRTCYTEGKHAGRVQKLNHWLNTWTKWINIVVKDQANVR